MATIVNMHQAKSSLSRLVERALAGEEVVIARNGEPLVRLVPAPKKPQTRVPRRSKDEVSTSPDLESTEEDITELSEGPISPET